MDTLEEKVNSVVDTMTKGDDGKWQLPEDLPEELRFAAMAERRRRDTQAEYSRVQNRLKALEAENSQLAAGWEADLTAKLTLEQQADLAELKLSDPDAWRAKLGELEQEARNKFAETRTQIASKATAESEKERRERVLADFLAANEGFELNDEIIENDLPPRFLKQLEKGEVDFETFLSNAHAYLTKGKTVAPGEPAPKGPNLGKAGGGAVPEGAAVDADIIKSYRNEVY